MTNIKLQQPYSFFYKQYSKMLLPVCNAEHLEKGEFISRPAKTGYSVPGPTYKQATYTPISWQPLKRPAVYARVHAWWLNALQSREKIGLARVQTTKQATQPVALAAWEMSDYTKLKSPTEQRTWNRQAGRQAGSGFCCRISLYWRFALPVFKSIFLHLRQLPVTAN